MNDQDHSPAKKQTDQPTGQSSERSNEDSNGQAIDVSKYLRASGDTAIWIMKLRQSGRTEAEVDEVIRNSLAQTEHANRQDTLRMQLDFARIAFTYPKVEGDPEFQRILNLFIRHILIGQFANIKLNYAASDVVAYESDKAKEAGRSLSNDDIQVVQKGIAWMHTMAKIATDYFVKRQQGLSFEEVKPSAELQAEIEKYTGQFSATLLEQFLKAAWDIKVEDELPGLLQAFDLYLNQVLVHLDHGAQSLD